MNNNIPPSQQSLSLEAPPNSQNNRRDPRLPPGYVMKPVGVLNPEFLRIAHEEIEPNFVDILENLKEMIKNIKSPADFNIVYNMIETMKKHLNSFNLIQTYNVREINRPSARRRRTRRRRQ